MDCYEATILTAVLYIATSRNYTTIVSFKVYLSIFLFYKPVVSGEAVYFIQCPDTAGYVCSDLFSVFCPLQLFQYIALTESCNIFVGISYGLECGNGCPFAHPPSGIATFPIDLYLNALPMATPASTVRVVRVGVDSLG